VSDEELTAAFDAINAKLAIMSGELSNLTAQIGKLAASEKVTRQDIAGLLDMSKARAIDCASLMNRVGRLELSRDRP
jgi:hypothetical protein